MARCGRCGRSWRVQPRADGTLPKTARCAIGAGGCGRPVSLPVSRPAIATLASATAPRWDPPSEPRGVRRCDVLCPLCGEGKVYASPRGTRQVCKACHRLVIPPGVLAPYERGGEVARAARSQRERDDDAKQTVIMAGEFLRRVTALLNDSKIHPASADLLGWYEEEITEARKDRDAARLAELAGEFADDRAKGAFRRMHFWQGHPAELTAAEVDDAHDDDDEYQDDERAAVVLATPASIAAQQQRAQPQRATWANAFAAHGWRLAPPRGDSVCQVTEHGQRCAEQIGGHPPVSDGLTRDGWACSGHYYALAETTNSINRARGFT